MGAPVEVDVSKLEPGAMLKVEWRGKAIYVLHRTPQMLAQLEGVAGELRDPDSLESDQPDFAKNVARAIKPEYLVLVGVCTHLGCAPLDKFTPGPVVAMVRGRDGSLTRVLVSAAVRTVWYAKKEPSA
jgi:ubiquinol-cytochrome c reductase iron-sulfur subunit